MNTILIVEDDADIRDNLSELLSLSNYKVETAADGKTGIEKAREIVPDLIISDVSMPIIDGYGMLHALRRNPETEHIPVVFLTGSIEHSDFRNAMQSGADDYITKPFNVDQLFRTIENRLKRSEVLKNHIRSNKQEIGELLFVVNDANSLEELSIEQEIVTYQKRQIIFKEGNTPRYLYQIQKGKVRIYKTHEDGKQLVTGLYGAGDYLGYTALLEESTYKSTAETLEETELVLIPRKSFEELLHKNVSVANRVIKILAKNVSEKEEHLLWIAYDSLRKKVANALVELEKKYHIDKNGRFYIDLTRVELAAIAGTATESLIRSLSEFKQEKLIEIGKDNQIEVINLAGLQNLVR